MKTDEQYVAEFVALFEKHLTWNNQRVMDMFKAEHGSMNEDEVVRLFNKWVRKGKIPLRSAGTKNSERNPKAGSVWQA